MGGSPRLVFCSFLVGTCLLRDLLVQAEECPNACARPDNLKFCGTQITFSVCRTASSWSAQDSIARTHFDEILAQYNLSSTNLAELVNSTSTTTLINTTTTTLDVNTTTGALVWKPTCVEALKQYQCALAFPICEIGTDANRLCASECKPTMTRLCPTLLPLCSMHSADDDIDMSNNNNHRMSSSSRRAVKKSDTKCFQLNYTGPEMTMWIAGFSISLVFSILNSIGINLQKYSLTKNKHAAVKRSSFQQPLWVLGFSLICLGSILDFVAFGMAPQTLLAPLAALSLVWNMFIAPIFHKEKVTQNNIVATIIIFIGVTITVIYAGHSTPTYELEDLIQLYCQPVMYAYIISVGVFLATLIGGAKYIERPGSSGAYHQNGLVHVICYGGSAGTFGGQSVLLAKSTVELVKSAVWGPEVSSSSASPFLRLETWLIITGMIVCLICQISYLNAGLKRFDALVMVPVYQSFWILMSVLGGIMYFEEYTTFTFIQTLMFPLGGFITMIGIFVLLQDGRHQQLSKSSSSSSGGGRGRKSKHTYVELSRHPDSQSQESPTESLSSLELENEFSIDDDEEAAQHRFDLELEDHADPDVRLRTRQNYEDRTSSSSSSYYI